MVFKSYNDKVFLSYNDKGFLSYNDKEKVEAACVAGTLFCCAFGKKENDCPLLK